MRKKYNRRFTGKVIAPIGSNQIFVFSSYSNGYNKAGTAKAALNYFGAQHGIGNGRTGQSYAIPSEVGLNVMKEAVDEFIRYASLHPDLEFLVTPIGLGKIFKRDLREMALLFENALECQNILLPKEFVDVLDPDYILSQCDVNLNCNQKESVESQPNENNIVPGQTTDIKKQIRSRGIKIFVGDIVKQSVDAIVNAANKSLLGGGGIDGCIHKAAGPGLLGECKTLHGCDVGQAKITKGYNLPAKYVIHAVGPNCNFMKVSDAEPLLRSCYKSVLDIALQYRLSSICFCCISTGIFGFPKDRAAEIALEEIIHHPFDGEVMICCYTPNDKLPYDNYINNN